MRSQLALGGARPTLFQVQFFNPATSVADVKVPVMVNAASLPASTLGTINVPYYGRVVKMAGDRTYDPWNVTIINDEDFLVRDALETWSTAINSAEGNVRGFGTSASSAYKSDAIVTQFSKTGVAIRQYTFIGIYPSQISPIELNWGAMDQLESFQVTFQYDYWEVTGGITGNAGGA
jgi:hypothetical protein